MASSTLRHGPAPYAQTATPCKRLGFPRRAAADSFRNNFSAIRSREAFFPRPAVRKAWLTLTGLSINAFSRLHPSPYSQTYSADFQYQLTSTSVLELGYGGVQGRKLFYGYSSPLNINQLPPQYLSLGQRVERPGRQSVLWHLHLRLFGRQDRSAISIAAALSAVHRRQSAARLRREPRPAITRSSRSSAAVSPAACKPSSPTSGRRRSTTLRRPRVGRSAIRSATSTTCRVNDPSARTTCRRPLPPALPTSCLSAGDASCCRRRAAS